MVRTPKYYLCVNDFEQNKTSDYDTAFLSRFLPFKIIAELLNNYSVGLYFTNLCFVLTIF